MSSLNGFMSPNASRNATPDHVEALRQNILGASLPSSLRAMLNKMSPEHRAQIETLAKLLHQSAMALGILTPKSPNLCGLTCHMNVET